MPVLNGALMRKSKINLVKTFPGVAFGWGVQVCGVSNVMIGCGSCIADDVWLNVCQRDDKKRLRIGRCVLIGRRGMINSGGRLEIGDFTVLGPNVYVGNADHVYTDLELPLLMQGATLNRSVVVEENCWLAMNSVISGQLTVGRGSVVGANAVVIGDVPPFSVMVGNPAQVVKMYDPLKKAWVSIRNKADKKVVRRNRERYPLPDRVAYRTRLWAKGFRQVSSIVAGREWHL